MFECLDVSLEIFRFAHSMNDSNQMNHQFNDKISNIKYQSVLNYVIVIFYILHLLFIILYPSSYHQFSIINNKKYIQLNIQSKVHMNSIRLIWTNLCYYQLNWSIFLSFISWVVFFFVLIYFCFVNTQY